MNGVIYARYSREGQREESIEGQIRECTEYYDKNGITVVRTYIDRALSAKIDHRPEFQRMIKDSARGPFEAVVAGHALLYTQLGKQVCKRICA